MLFRYHLLQRGVRAIRVSPVFQGLKVDVVLLDVLKLLSVFFVTDFDLFKTCGFFEVHDCIAAANLDVLLCQEIGEYGYDEVGLGKKVLHLRDNFRHALPSVAIEDRLHIC